MVRVLVSLKDCKIVVPNVDPDIKLGAFVKELEKRFETQGIKPGELRIVEVTTNDGYMLNFNDRVADVVEPSDRLIAIEFSDWVNRESQ